MELFEEELETKVGKNFWKQSMQCFMVLHHILSQSLHTDTILKK